MPIVVGVFFAALFAVQAQPAPSPAPPSPGNSTPSASAASPAPGPTAAPSPAPGAASAAPSATPLAPAGSASPAPSTTSLYKFVYRASPSPGTAAAPVLGAPSIDEIDLNDSTIVTPGALHVRVLTSAAVVSVTAETLGRSVTIPLRERGMFAYDGLIPAVPFFLRNQTYDVHFVASAQDGRTTNVTLPLTLK